MICAEVALVCATVHQAKSSSCAGQTAQVGLPSSNAETKPLLRAAINTLSDKLQRPLVLEGALDDEVPLQSAIDDRGEAGNKSNDRKTTRGASEEASLNDFCDAFGLDWHRRGNALVLKRDYEKRHYVPEVTLLECADVARDIDRALAPYRSVFKKDHIYDDPSVTALVGSLTSDQLSKMQIPTGNPLTAPVGTVRMFNKSEKETLAISDMAPEQQKTIQSIVMNSYTGQAQQNAELLHHEIKSIVTDGADFTWKDMHGLHLLGYELALRGKSGDRVFVPISSPEQAQRVNGELALTLHTTDNKTGGETQFTDTTAPVRKAVTIPDDASNTDFLSSVAMRLSVKTGLPDTVDESLNEKPITVVGERFCVPGDALSALAEAYGLRVRISPEQGRKVVRFPFRPVDNITELQNALWAAVPDPFTRALRPDTSATVGTAGVSTALPPAKLGAQYRGRLLEIRAIAVRALRASLDAKIAASRKGRVSLSELNRSERLAFAEVWMCDFLSELEFVLPLPAPKDVANYDQLRLGVAYDHTAHGTFCEFIFYVPSTESKGYVMDHMFGVRTDLPGKPVGDAGSSDRSTAQ